MKRSASAMVGIFVPKSNSTVTITAWLISMVGGSGAGLSTVSLVGGLVALTTGAGLAFVAGITAAGFSGADLVP